MVGPVRGGGSDAATLLSGRWINQSSQNVCPVALGLSEERQELVTAHVIARPGDGAVLSKATARASELLGLNAGMLAKNLGLSESAVSRILSQGMPIDPHSKQGELALLLVRLSSSLDDLMGTDDGKRMLWMTGFNKGLRGVPQQLVQRVDGLVATLAYLDAMRAPA